MAWKQSAAPFCSSFLIHPKPETNAKSKPPSIFIRPFLIPINRSFSSFFFYIFILSLSNLICCSYCSSLSSVLLLFVLLFLLFICAKSHRTSCRFLFFLWFFQHQIGPLFATPWYKLMQGRDSSCCSLFLFAPKKKP